MKQKQTNLNIYKYLNTVYISNLRVVSMSPGDLSVAGCFSFYNSSGGFS